MAGFLNFADPEEDDPRLLADDEGDAASANDDQDTAAAAKIAELEPDLTQGQASAVPAAAGLLTPSSEPPAKRGLLSKIFGTDARGSTFGDRMMAASMGLAGNTSGEADFLSGIGDRTARQAALKQQQLGQQIDSQAFNGAWDTDEKTGRRTFNQDRYLTLRQQLAQQAKLSLSPMGAAQTIKAFSDANNYTLQKDDLGNVWRINKSDGSKTLELKAGKPQEFDTKDKIYLMDDADGGAAGQTASAGGAAAAPTGDAGPAPAAPQTAPYLAAVGKREGTAQNPNSSASGVGQFLGKLDQQGHGKGTWFDVMRNDPQFAKDIAGKSDAEILAMRADPNVANRAIASYAATNAPILQAAGITPDAPALGLAHGYGPAGAARIIKAAQSAPNTPMESLIGPHTALINRVAGKTAGQVVANFQQQFAGGAPAAATGAATPAAATEAMQNGLTADELKQLGPAPKGKHWFKPPASGDEQDITLTDDAAHLLAGRYLKDGTLPQMRDNKGLAKTKILNIASDMAKSLGLTAGDLISGTADIKATASALAKNTTQLAAIKGYEDTAGKNADLALSLAPKGGAQFNNNVLNRWVQTGRRAIAGDPSVTSFDVALGTFLDEYTKVVVGSNGGAGTTDAARKESYDRLSKYASQGQLASGIATMKQEMRNRTSSMEDVNEGLRSHIRGTAGGGSAETSPPPPPAVSPPPAAPKPPPLSVLQEGRIRTLPTGERWALRKGHPVFVGMAAK